MPGHVAAVAEGEAEEAPADREGEIFQGVSAAAIIAAELGSFGVERVNSAAA